MKELKEIYIHQNGTATLDVVAKKDEHWSEFISKRFNNVVFEFREVSREIKGDWMVLKYYGR